MPEPRPPYYVEIASRRCARCGHGGTYDVCRNDPEPIALSQSWGDKDEADWMCDQMNEAWLLGRRSVAEVPPAPAAVPEPREWGWFRIRRDPANAGRSARFYSLDSVQVQPFADDGNEAKSIPVIANSFGDFGELHLPAGHYTARIYNIWGDEVQSLEVYADPIPF